MKQLTQSLKDGTMSITEVPAPACKPGYVLVRTLYSAVSAGTEGKTVSDARKGLIAKARSRKKEVRMVLDLARTAGIRDTYRIVRNKLDAYSPLGYACMGEVIEVAADVTEFRVGDLVACGGADAAHAEIVCVGRNLCALLPDGVDARHAAITTIAAIALQGVRQAELHLGETAVVIGLGLIGQLTMQYLRAQGCTAIGVDIDERQLRLARSLGFPYSYHSDQAGLEATIADLTHGIGADAVIITAGSASLWPVNFAGAVSRKKGQVVIVGAVPTGFDRKDYYRKELDLRMSSSYGPGRYDSRYEEQGVDYPVGYVRWTEQRNMQAYLDLLASGYLDIEALISHEFPLEQAKSAYDTILARQEHVVGVLLRYESVVTGNPRHSAAADLRPERITEADLRHPERSAEGEYGSEDDTSLGAKSKGERSAEDDLGGEEGMHSGAESNPSTQRRMKSVASRTSAVGASLRVTGGGTSEHRASLPTKSAAPRGAVRVSFIGAGSFAQNMILPNLKGLVEFRGVATGHGNTAQFVMDKYGFAFAAGDADMVLRDEESDAVFIMTRHDSHARYVVDALRADKDVFVEKPLALYPHEIEEIEQAYAASKGRLMLGFNRRFAPQIQQLKAMYRDEQVKSISYRINAGNVPPEHWVHNPAVGGGRIIGEACHFIDLCMYLAGAPISSVQAVDSRSGAGLRDTVAISLGFANGSIASISYFSNGSKQLPKERIEVFCGGSTAVLDDFRELHIYGDSVKSSKLKKQDKGHAAGVRAFVEALRNGAPSPIPFDEIVRSTWATFGVMDKLRGII
ncbi:MAG TPA: bi-domain-containing oxidoreductase [Bacteroidota bacterium]|nr:bi-domain-containing oxidoreductase [Bacteroidota bacterium]